MQLLLGELEAVPVPNPKSPLQGKIYKTTEKQREASRRFYRNHPERNKEIYSRFYAKHPKSEYDKAYLPRRRALFQLRKDEVYASWRTPEYRAKRNSYMCRKRKEDGQFLLMRRLRNRMWALFRQRKIKKPDHTEALLGCTIGQAKEYIETQFQSGMSWDNRASFVIDHLIPVSAFDLSDIEEAHWSFNFLNLRPITQHDNGVKFNTLPNPLPCWLPAHLAARIIERASE